MVDLIRDEDIAKGDVVLNIGDPVFQQRSGALEHQWKPILARVLAYVPFTEQLFVPFRHLRPRRLPNGKVVQSDLWLALTAAPELLQEGVVAPDRRHRHLSFAHQAERNGYPPEDIEVAVRLDELATKVRPFGATTLGMVYRDRVLADLDPDGGLRRALMSKASDQRGTQRALETLVADFPSGALGPRTFVEFAADRLPRRRQLLHRWAQARYYTTPLEQDSRRVREIPTWAARLLVANGALMQKHLPEEQPELLRRGSAVIGIQLARIERRFDHRRLVDHLLEIRRTLLEARSTFGRLLAEDHARAGELVEALNEEFMAQLRRRRRGRSLAQDVAIELATALDVASKPLPNKVLSGVAGLAVGALANRLRASRATRIVPWAMVHERLGSFEA